MVLVYYQLLKTAVRISFYESNVQLRRLILGYCCNYYCIYYSRHIYLLVTDYFNYKSLL